ncbi:MAG: RDD family protein [Deltaproteobacteria bacterium]|nr:RDD family protein [Deltaproteobacteria bacterium]
MGLKPGHAIASVVLAAAGVLFAALLSAAVFLLFRAEAGSIADAVLGWAVPLLGVLTLFSFAVFPGMIAHYADLSTTAPLAAGSPAPFKLRVTARIIDDLLWVAPLTAPVFDRLWSTGIVDSLGIRPVGAAFAALVLLTNGLFEWHFGVTPGKLVTGIRVRSIDGSPVRFWQAVVRNLARLVDGFVIFPANILTMTDSPLRQRLGDRWAGTTVVKRKA